MESHINVSSPTQHNNADLNLKDSAANFQKFIFDLLEQNGVINDLRTYLRGHILNVLKSAQIGELPACQKHLNQRLDLFYQAINMLVAEYLLRLNFSYSLSVFVSEIPLANMVFGFAKKLMHSNNEDEDIKFRDNDIWSIVNYLGVKCDSEYVTQVTQMYNKGSDPLLLCILKTTSSGHSQWDQFDNTSSESAPSGRSSDVNMKCSSKTSTLENCHHITVCKTCQLMLSRLKKKYKKKKKYVVKSAESEVDQLKVKTLMRNVGVIEQSIIDEMFEQLKAVYETEVDLMMREEEKKMKRSQLVLQERMDEMEKSFKIREQELERKVQEKKKFLWELARALREQHAQMSRAMSAVRQETNNLTVKEDNLKSQILDAEEVLRKRGEEMRAQISNELQVLENHLESMRKEREEICRERKQLEELKAADNDTRFKDLATEDLCSHYNTLKEELMAIKKHFEPSNLDRRCVIERSTITEPSDTSKTNVMILNNEQDADRYPLKSESDNMIGNPHKLVNDLKKQKNVNFRLSSNTQEAYCVNREGRIPSRSSSSEVGDAHDRDCDLIARLRDENDHLRAFARQQREHIDELSSHRARLQAELSTARLLAEYPVPSRPRTAPTVMPRARQITRLNPNTSSHNIGWPKGGGEEVSRFMIAPPRILTPADQVPFIGSADNPADTKRHLINQWRSLRRRVCPVSADNYLHSTAARERSEQDEPATSTPFKLDREGAVAATADEKTTSYKTCERRPKIPLRCATTMLTETQQAREKSPKSVLREAKEKLKNYVKEHPDAPKRYKTPESVLREAKLRLRKLEIEAEAVENSYLSFRKRQEELRRRHDTENIGQMVNYIESQSSRHENVHEKINVKNETSNFKTEYENLDAAVSRLNDGHLSIPSIKPIPKSYLNIESELKQSDERREYYLETPLIEFRKLYHSERDVIQKRVSNEGQTNSVKNKENDSVIDIVKGTENFEESESYVDKISKEIELDILQGNVSKTSNLNNSDDISGTDVILKRLSYDGHTKFVENKENDLVTDIMKGTENVEESDSNVDKISKEIEIFQANVSKTSSLNNPEEIAEKTEAIIESDDMNSKLLSKPKIEFEEIPRNDPHDNVLAEKTIVLNQEQPNETFNPQLMLEIEPLLDTKEIDIADADGVKITEMVIIVSPSADISPERNSSAHERKSPISAKIIEYNNTKGISSAVNSNEHSSVEIELNISQEKVDGIRESQHSSVEVEPTVSKENNEDVTETEKGEEDYPDDFSADVDNYNSRSYDESHSPISLAKNSDDDPFWDS